MSTMDRMAQPPEDLEVWVNSLDGIVVVKKFNELGRLEDVLVYGGRKVELTPKERRTNMERAYDSSLDPFRNGTLQPVRLVETEKDVASLKDNPNVMTDGEMRQLFGMQWRAFEKKIGEISSPLLVRRLIAIASEPETNASVRSMETLRRRLEELQPKQYDEVENVGSVPTGVPAGI